MDLLFLKHLHPLTMITPDHSHVMELLNNTQKKTQELSFLIDQAHTISVQMKQATKWMTKVYQNGAEPVNFTTEQSSHIDQLLGHIKSRDNSNPMCYHAATLNPGITVTQCAIMPPIADVFTVKEHMLLRIIIYLFQFLLCSIQVLLAYHHLWNRLRQEQTVTHLTTIRICDSHYHPINLHSTHHNNNHGHYLPSQPHLQCPSIQWA